MVLTFISALSAGGDVQALQKRLIFRHLAVFLAVKARMWHLGPESYRTYLDDDDAVAIEGKDHVPIALLLLQARTLEHCVQSGYLDNYRMVAMSHTLNEITRVVGACDRIKGTPFFPFYFSAVRYTLWVFVVFFPTAIADTAGYWAVLHTFLLSSLMVWLAHSADAVSRPFDRQPSAVALEDCMRTIEIDLLQQLGKEAVPSRVMPVNNLYLP